MRKAVDWGPASNRLDFSGLSSGLIHDVRIYDRAVEPWRVTRLANTEGAGSLRELSSRFVLNRALNPVHHSRPSHNSFLIRHLWI